MFNRNLLIAVKAALNTDASEEGQTGVNLTALAQEAEVPETDEDRQARKARLDRSREQAAKASNDGTAMPAELLGLAQQEIQVCWKEFSGKDGVYDAVKRAKKGMANISGHILNIAKACAVAAYERQTKPDDDPIKLAGSMFRNAMAAAESSLRGSLDLGDDEAEAKLDSFLTSSWKVYQSQAKQGFDAGLDPKDYDSIYGITKAVKAIKEAKSTGTRTDKAKDEKPADSTEGSATTPEATSAKAAEGTEDDETTDEGEDDIGEGYTGDDTSDSQALADGSEVDIIAQGNAKVRGALILLHRAVHAVDTDVDNHEERLVNILRMATREVNKLTMDAIDLEQQEALKADESLMAKAVRAKLEAPQAADDLTVSEG